MTTNWLKNRSAAASTDLGEDAVARARLLALQQFHDRRRTGKAFSVQQGSLVLLSIVIGAMIGWSWSLPLAASMLVALLLERNAYRRLHTFLECAEPKSRASIERFAASTCARIIVATMIHVFPFTVLAFAPDPGPLLGLLLSFAAALVVSGQHTLSTSLALSTLSACAVPFLVSLAMLGEGWQQWVVIAIGGLLFGNVAVLNRLSHKAALQAIHARLDAELMAETLDQKVMRRTAELETMRREAEQANVAKSAFLANMSHELRTPLNAILGFSELIQESAVADGRTQDVTDSHRLINAGRHLLQSINEVLDLSKIEAGKMDLYSATFDCKAVLQEVADTMHPLLQANGNTLRVELAPNLGSGCSDELRLKQCVLNLLSNAAKFTKDGVVTLSARRIGGPAGECFEISVRDTGPGIHPELQARLFQPFCQADDFSNRCNGGTGLGLTITRRLSRAMGGDVAVQSKLGEGSVFTLTVATSLAAGPLAVAA